LRPTAAFAYDSAPVAAYQLWQASCYAGYNTYTRITASGQAKSSQWRIFLAAMSTKRPRSARPDRDATAICRRLAEVRLVAFGRRGRAAMAHALDVSPSTYNYYERNRVPPARLLARIAEVTGARLEWLVTGRGPQFAHPETQVTSAPDRPAGGLLNRLETLLGAAPRLEQPVTAFVRMLEEMAGVREPTAGGAMVPAVAGLIPVIGGTGAGVARFWRDYAPGGTGVTTLEQRVRDVLGRAMIRDRQPAKIAPAIVGEPAPTTEAREVALVQMTEPDGAGVVEFIDCPYVRMRTTSAFGLRVDGDSMAPRCRDGDIVLLSPDEPAREGRPAVVKLKGQIGATCKLYVPHGDRLHLVPVNENYPTTEHALDAVEWALAVLWRVALAPES